MNCKKEIAYISRTAHVRGEWTDDQRKYFGQGRKSVRTSDDKIGEDGDEERCAQEEGACEGVCAAYRSARTNGRGG